MTNSTYTHIEIPVHLVNEGADPYDGEFYAEFNISKANGKGLPIVLDHDDLVALIGETATNVLADELWQAAQDSECARGEYLHGLMLDKQREDAEQAEEINRSVA